MSTGRLGAINLTLGTNTAIYTVPISTVTTLNISVCNRTASVAKIRIALVDGSIGSLVNGDYIEYDAVLAGNTSLSRNGIVLKSGQTVVIRSDIANVSTSCWGFEDSI